MSFQASGAQPPGAQQAPPVQQPQSGAQAQVNPPQPPPQQQQQPPVSAPVQPPVPAPAAVGTIGQPQQPVPQQQPQQSVTPQSGGEPMPPTMPVYPDQSALPAGEGFQLSIPGGNTLIPPTPFQPQQPQGERFPTAGQPRPGTTSRLVSFSSDFRRFLCPCTTGPRNYWKTYSTKGQLLQSLYSKRRLTPL